MAMITEETLTNNSFDVFFQFDDLDKKENQILNDTFIWLKEDQAEFELKVIDKKAQPLDILIKLKSTESLGECNIKMKNRTSSLVDLTIKNFKVKEIIGLLDFHVQDDSDKNVKIVFESDELIYKTKDIEESI